MEERNIEKAIEALLFSSDKPLSVQTLKNILGGLDTNTVKKELQNLKDYYDKENRSFYLIELAGGYQLVSKPQYSIWINKLYKKPPDKIRGASMETLAIIVYKQPITKAEIEAIRGVNVDGVIKTLLERELIRMRGRKETPGRPLVYGTTDKFLIRFGLKDLKSLPPLKEFTEKDLEYAKESEELVIDGSSPEEGDIYESENTAR